MLPFDPCSRGLGVLRADLITEFLPATADHHRRLFRLRTFRSNTLLPALQLPFSGAPYHTYSRPISKMPEPVSVLFVCLGNICRSTMAEGVFQHLTSRTPYKGLVSKLDSCGTGAYHVGDDPDDRTLETLQKHGVTDYKHAARKVSLSTTVRTSLCALDPAAPSGAHVAVCSYQQLTTAGACRYISKTLTRSTTYSPWTATTSATSSA